MSEHPSRGQRWFKILVLGLFLPGMAVLFLAPSCFPVLYVLNASGVPGLTVWVDGKALSGPLPSTPTESYRSIASGSFLVGSHRLRTVDASGQVLDERTVAFGWGSFGHLYAPGAGSAGTCFALTTTGYGSLKGETGTRPLDRAADFWSFDQRVDDWFAGAPRSVTAKADGAVRHGVRRVPCPGP